MKLRVTTDLEGDELAKALAGVAVAHGIDGELATILRKAGPPQDPFDMLDWQKKLRELSGPESIWADPQLQAVEDRMVRFAATFARDYLTDILPAIRRLLINPTEVKYTDFLRTSQIPKRDEDGFVDDVKQELDDAIHLAVVKVRHDEKQPSKGPSIELPKPPKPVRLVPNKQQTRLQAEWLARQSAASKMREWASGMKEDVRWQVVQAIRDGADASKLEDRLRERWSDYGSRLRTIAATELAIAFNDATLTLLAGKHVVIPPIGDEKVCKSCAHWLEGRVFYVSPKAIENPTKQELEQYLWPGKSNIGRKQPDWKPALPMHPNCRHVAVLYRGGDPKEY